MLRSLMEQRFVQKRPAIRRRILEDASPFPRDRLWKNFGLLPLVAPRVHFGKPERKPFSAKARNTQKLFSSANNRAMTKTSPENHLSVLLENFWTKLWKKRESIATKFM